MARHRVVRLELGFTDRAEALEAAGVVGVGDRFTLVSQGV
jgi:hypothetical protein